jgi:hypothetical protein
MKLSHLSLFGIFLLSGVTLGWSEPSFWNNGEPTPSALKPPQVAPYVDESAATKGKGPSSPVTIDAPALGDAAPLPTPAPGKKAKSPTQAGLFSALLPGAGQVYAGQPIRGLVIAGVFGVTLWQSLEQFKKRPGESDMKNPTAGQLLGLVTIAAYGFGVQDAYDGANRYNRRFHLKVSIHPTTGPRLSLARSF